MLKLLKNLARPVKKPYVFLMVKIIKSSAQKGFSLIELSIVMSIIGLLVGGVLAGKGLISSQRKNVMISKMTTLRAAYGQFLLKYGYRAGDFPTATQVWGRADGGTPVTSNCALPSTDNSNPSGTCNGNGNGVITDPESRRAWQQLAFAGLISGTYSGVYSGASDKAFPNSELNPKAFFIYGGIESYLSASSSDMVVRNNSDTFYYDGDYRDALVYANDLGACTACGGPLGVAVSGEDANSIDGKLDDALPGTGKVLTRKPSAISPNCISGSQYDITQTQNACMLIFMADKKTQ